MKHKLLLLFLTTLIGINSFSEATTECCPAGTPECCPEPETVGKYPYFVVGTGPILLIPNVALGYRTRRYKAGYDISLGYSTVGYVHQIQGLLVRHFYLDPFVRNSSYLGLGVAASCVITNDGEVGGLFAPDFVFGKQLGKIGERKHFIEFHLQIPNLYTDRHGSVTPLPLMFIKYGTSF